MLKFILNLFRKKRLNNEIILKPFNDDLLLLKKKKTINNEIILDSFQLIKYNYYGINYIIKENTLTRKYLKTYIFYINKEKIFEIDRNIIDLLILPHIDIPLD